MSNHLPTVPADDSALAARLDELGLELVAAETDAAPASDSPFMQAVERRAQFQSASRLAPRLALAAAAAIALVAGYLVIASRPPIPAPPVASGPNAEDFQPPTLANLRKLNQDVTSPDKLKLAGNGVSGPSTPGTEPRPISPLDARAADRIDAITGEK